MQTKILIGIGVLMLLGLAFFFPSFGNKEQSKEMQNSAPTKTQQEESMKGKQYTSQPAPMLAKGKTYTATISTEKGNMVIQLFADEVPVVVNNFVFLAREKFYDNTTFHRIIKGFMIQAGDPEGTGRGGPGYRFADEPITREYTRGTLAMANAGPNTNGSQFFIMHADYALPKNYVIFGQIAPNDTQSFATLDALAQTPVTDNGMGEDSQPVSTVYLKSVTIEEK